MATRRSTRKSHARRAARRLLLQSLERRELLAADPRLISVAANSGENFDLLGNNELSVAPRQLTFRFDGGQEIDPATLSAFRFTGSGGDGSFSDGNEVPITPGFIGLGESSRIVIARFSTDLPDDQYRISIAGFDQTDQGLVALRNIDGNRFQPTNPADATEPVEEIFFNVEVGPRVVAVVPQPITGTGASRVQHRNQVYVYFNNDPLANPAAGRVTSTGSASDPAVVRPEFYSLFFTADTVENTDDVVEHPTSITYDPQLNRAELTFAGSGATPALDLSDLPGAVTAGGSGTYRLRIGSSQPLPLTLPAVSEGTDAADTFSGARNLGIAFGTAGAAGRIDSSVIISGEIEATAGNTIRWPGIDAPGVRDDRRDAQVIGRSDTNDGVNIFHYNFADLYGSDAAGNNLENAITPAQKQRTREILDLYSEQLGVQFIETENRGLQIVTGDMRALVEGATTGAGAPFQEYRVNDLDPAQGVLVLDAAEPWFDGYGLSPDDRPSWFIEALRGIGSLLGLGHTFEQVPGVASGSNPLLYNAGMFGATPGQFSIEPDFLSSSDIIPGQALHRPEIRDADLYQFRVTEPGRISVETFAQRMLETSLLDTDLKLWKFDSITRQYELVARNADFYGDDSFIGVDVEPEAGGGAATYVIGITANGNNDYNPDIADSGGGGRSQGKYDLRISFAANRGATIEDTNGSRLDGDSDGVQGGDFNFWFRVAKTKTAAGADEARTLFVNRDGVDSASNGTLAAPYRTINYAFSQARAGDIVRLLPDGGTDGNIGTTADNRAYEIGRGGSGNLILTDGETFEVPQGVTVMIDAGAILKLRNAKVSVGSASVDEDRSLAALQILGAPLIIDQNGQTIDGSVDFTSYNEERRSGALFGRDTNALPTTPGAGDWAGIEFRNDFDYSEGRGVWETEGIFLDYVSHADIRYGGGSITLTEPIVTPLHLFESRPTLIYNHISDSRDAAISADPDSFQETNFHAPIYQQAAVFTSDYDRVGPLVRGNRVTNNSINGLFIRVETPAVDERKPLTVSGRLDDRDITHVVSEVLVLQGLPGGPQLLENRPDVLSTTVTTTGSADSGSLAPGSVVNYRVTFVTDAGYESLASLPTRDVTVGPGGSVALDNLPAAPSEFSGRRLYRVLSNGDYEFVTQLDRATSTYTDDGTTRGGLLPAAALATSTGERLLPRIDARLSIDPGLVLKLDSARLEATFGADFYAEGLDGNPVVFTSRLDDRFGAGGTFDTNNDADAGVPAPGDWSGLVFRQGSSASIDHAIISYGGGDSAVSGGFEFFNPIEILQADVRLAHSVISNNASGTLSGASDYEIRDSVGFNGPATIFVRGAQPVIVGNTITDNAGAAVSINPDGLSYLSVSDAGRGTGSIDRFVGDADNQGPLVEGNRLSGNGINGMLIRNEALTTESVWDDTDIVHVVEHSVYAWNHHHRSALRLKSDPNQSLVVKFNSGGSLVADRYRTDVEDSIGGTLQVLGQPGFAVVLTSVSDDTVGAGFTPAGLPQNDTDGASGSAAAGDWRGIVVGPGSNDRNVAFIPEAERAVATSSTNAIPATAQFLGSLAQNEVSADENRRLGFNVRGSLSQDSDIDVYSFTANGGTEVYFDIDDTDFGLDTVVELIDINGNILALSNNSEQESVTPSELFRRASMAAGSVMPLYKTGKKIVENPNVLDAGMRVIVPGNSSTLNQYYVRVRSSNLRPADPVSRLTDPTFVGAGMSSGQYQLSIRLRETDEVAGTTVRLADIRYATTAIELPAAPNNSPLAGEHAEELDADGLDVNNNAQSVTFQQLVDGTATVSFANNVADPLGQLSLSDRGVLRVSGELGNQVASSNITPDYFKELDLDVYEVDIRANRQSPDIIDENRFVSTIFDLDYADQFGGPNTSLAVYTSAGRLILHSRDSNIADDQGRPTRGNDPTNLAAGSAGTLDAYIGPVELQEGRYFVVVSSAQMVPATLNQLFQNNPVSSSVRMLPIDSSRRIGEFGFNENSVIVNGSPVSSNLLENTELNTAADVPTLRPLFDETSIVPYKLEDVRLFVSLNRGLSGNNNTTLISVDPFTGQLERTIGQFGQPTGDLAIRRDGELFAYSLGPASGGRNAANTGNYLNVSSANAAANNAGDDGLAFRRNNAAADNTENDDNGFLAINAMAFVPSTSSTPGNNPSIPDGERMLAVGNRTSFGRGELPDALRRNVLYSMVANNGSATNQDSTNGDFDRNFGNSRYNEFFGPGSNKQEFGIVDTGQFADSPAPPDGPYANASRFGGDVTGIANDPTSGTRVFALTDAGYVYSFNPRGVTRTVDVEDDTTGLFGDYSRVINTTNHGLVTPDPDDRASVNRGFVNFQSLTFGPAVTEEGRFRSVLFGVTREGWIYALNIEPSTQLVEPAPVLMDGNYAIPMVDSFGFKLNENPVGVAFSTRQENIWHTTSDFSIPFGSPEPNAHGVFPNHNQTRIRIAGGSSLYFGNEIDANQDNNTLDGGNGTLSPGGVHGTTVSAPFSLEGYDSADKPTLYFTYLLETQGDSDYLPPNRLQTDSFRVFAAGDDGQWRLVSTNDTWRSWSNLPTSRFGGDDVARGDEYDYFAANGGIPVQELFDNTNLWRQARIDLSPLAGDKNVQLRFDFSTAGGMQSQTATSGYLTEIQATAGTDVVDGSSFSLFDNTSTLVTRTFEFVRGAAVQIPSGREIPEGQRISFSRTGAPPITITLTTDASTSTNRVTFSRSDSADAVASRIAAALNASAPALAATAAGNELRVPEATSFALSPERFEGTTASQFLGNGNVPIFYNEAMSSVAVRDAIRRALANGLGDTPAATGVSEATIANYPAYGTNRIRLYNKSVVADDTTLGFSTFLPGDEFGSFGSTSVTSTQINTRPGENNDIQGVYVDDIIVGFAERGEVVLNAPSNQTFEVLPEVRTETFDDDQQPEFLDETLVGNYTLEIRAGAEYGVPQDYDPVRLELDELSAFGRSFDSNDRLTAEGVTLIAPSGVNLLDGDIFVLGNGSQQVTFEFDSDGSVGTGRVRVPFTPLATGTSYSPLADDAHVVATAIRNAINSPQAFNVLGILAAGRDSREVGTQTDNRVELFGKSIQVNPTSGRFTKIDLTAEETFYGRETARTMPAVDHATQTVIDAVYPNTFARATTTNFVNGTTDTIVATGKIGDNVLTRDGGGDIRYNNGISFDGDISVSQIVNNNGNVLIGTTPASDIDIVKIYLREGDKVDVDMDTVGWNLGTVYRSPTVAIYGDIPGSSPQLEAATAVSMAPGETDAGAFINDFEAPRSGYYYVAVGARNLFVGTFGEYQLTVRPSSVVTNGVTLPNGRDVLMVDYHLEKGDTNVFRDQGQYIVESNFVRDFANAGIVASFNAGQADDDEFFSRVPIDRRPGAAATLRNANTARLLPGTVISNNVVISDGGTGIVFAGEVAPAGDSPAPVPFGRIVNNTVVGVGSGQGIAISANASPTVLNNIVAGFATGVDIAANSASTIEGGNAYQNNVVDSTRPIAPSSFVISDDQPLFQDPADDIYIPAAGSAVIDSSFASLNDRSNFVNTVKQPVGISSSPIIAPSFDAYGIPRFDDPAVTTPGGVGSNVFIDRGAIDRADFVRPEAALVSPLDFISGAGVTIVGGDADPSESFVRLIAGSVSFFEIQLFDPSGSGPDPRTITEDSVILTENGIRLTPGVDYTFGYSANSRLIRLTPLAGLWRPDAVYDITLNNEDRVALTLPAGGLINDGDQYTITDSFGTSGRSSTFEFDSGFVLQVPQTLGIEVLGANSAFTDGEFFTIAVSDDQGTVVTSRTFEINRSGTVRGGRIAVNVGNPGDAQGPTITAVRDALLTALQDPAAAPLGLAPVAIGDDRLQIGSLAGHTISGNVAGLSFFGVDAGVAPGDQFRYTDAGGASVLFEFTNGTSPPSSSAARPIPILRTDTVDDIATTIANVVAAQPLGLETARAVGDGRVLLGGDAADTLTTIDTALILLGTAGVTGKLTLTVPDDATATTLEGTTFVVTSGNETETFQFTTDSALVTPNRVILLSPTATVTQIASAIRAEIDAGISTLTPTVSGQVVSLGEQDAIIAPGTAQMLASVDVSATSLVAAGVSGGAIAVPFLPTPGFSPAATATSLVNAINKSPLDVDSFSPGGGTLLFTNVRDIFLRSPDGTITEVGEEVPAISDLAGNPVDANRDDDETRFTIIMPEVRFDFGDAPNSYGTLLAQNGARHALTGGTPLRLGSFVDGEADGVTPPAADDDRLAVAVSGTTGTFSIDNTDPSAPRTSVVSTPTAGDTLTVTLGSRSATFELLPATANPSSGNIAVTFTTDEPLEEIARRLLVAIRSEFGSVAGAVQFSIDSTSSDTFVLEAIDDEDGVAVGDFTPPNGNALRVFVDSDATEPIDEAEVIGFINPEDPAGTNFQVNVIGTGLLDMWVDFNRDGDFTDPDEQVLSNAGVTDGINTLTIFAPASAQDGDSWMRLRLSDSGNLRPDGVAIGGEVEDYLISVRNVAPAVPIDDSYAISEDQTLDTSASSRLPLADNDLGLNDQLITPRVFVGEPPANGTLTILDPLNGDFRYVPNADFNGVDTFTYRLGTQADASPASLAVTTFATVTINVAAVNDAPSFTVQSTANLLEDSGTTITIPNVITGAVPGPATATDESASQTVVLGVDSAASTVPSGLMTQPATISQTGALTVYPATDAYGQAVYAITVADDGVPAQTVTTFVTINVRPVNDPPRPDPARLGEIDETGADNRYEIAAGTDPARPAGTLIYTLKEDGGSFFIPLRQSGDGLSFSRIGLLDPFLAGPANEQVPHEGGPQSIAIARVDSRTGANGTLTERFANGTLIGYDYTPPVDLNSDIAAFDTFSYEIVDRNGTDPANPEGYLDADGAPVDDPQSQTNQVILVLNPVNDAPQFSVPDPVVTVPEDAAVLTQDNFAINVFAGPPLSAFDEVDVFTGQNVSFTVTSLSFATDESAVFFSEYPTLSTDGTLRFQPAPDVFGEFRFSVVLNDNGPDNSIRGDEISSAPVTITINVLPVNDPPQRIDTVDDLAYTLREDTPVDVPLRGTTAAPGLLDLFAAGPANEAADTAPRPGGNQTIALDQPLPASTTAGGTLTPVLSQSGEVIALTYQPRANFVGTDSFIYGVVDNGQTVGLDGQTRPDPRRSFATVSFTVNPVNDAPLFSGGSNVVSDEDEGVVTVTNWTTNVQAGPLGADDEADGINNTPPQQLGFEFTQIAGPTDLFSSGPAAIINGSNANLTYTAAPDRNGVATFTVRLVDDGPSSGNGNVNASPLQTFTIRVNPINDAPSFVAGGPVTVAEDAGAYRETWATAISPGPADEQAASQTVVFEVTTAPDSLALFQTAPTIDADGVLQFVPAANANGTATVEVRAVDSAGGVSDAVTLNIVITEVNDAPIGTTDSIATDEDRVLTINVSQMLANDVDPDTATNADEVLSVVMPAEQFSTAGARVTFDAATGQVTYDPTAADTIQGLPPDQILTDSFVYRVRDVAGLESSPATVSLQVTGINDAPRVAPDNPSLAPGEATTIRPLDNDSDIDGQIVPSTLKITLQPAFGSLAISPHGTLTYTPFAGFTGEDVFRYTVADNLGQASAETTVVISANARPTANNDSGGTFLEEDVVIDVAANDTDLDGQINPASIQIVSQPTGGEAIPQADGTVRFVPGPGFVGFDSFTYTIADNEGRRSQAATVRLQVVASRLQNPSVDRLADVNDDGRISAIDALLVINRLNVAQGEGNTSGSVPVLDTDRGPDYYDVNGDKRISALDALEVLRVLNERDAFGQTTTPSSEGEWLEVASDQLSTSRQESLTRVDSDFIGHLPSGPNLASRSFDFKQQAGAWAVMLAEAMESDDDESRSTAIDAAMVDLLDG